MQRSELLAAFDKLRVWTQGGKRAVHKPLLVLLSLGRLARTGAESAEWSEIDADLRKLLERFGPSSAASSRHYPFWHLRTDGLWTLKGPDSILSRPPRATPNLTELRQQQISGGFAPQVLRMLNRDPALIQALATRIVESHFPDSLQSDVLEAVGLERIASGTHEATTRRRRDPAFREKVLRAYQCRCCVCGHDLRLMDQIVGLEAAHIRWVQANGPDTEPNGLALCSLHHKLFDLGAFTVQPESFVMVVSEQLNGGDKARNQILGYHGAGIIMPQRNAYLPDTRYLKWHAKEVFKEPARST